jgi:hypothetical protein
MAEAAWDVPASIMAVLVNSAPFRSGRAVKPSEFNPFAKKHDATPIKISIRDLKGAFGVAVRKRGGHAPEPQVQAPVLRPPGGDPRDGGAQAGGPVSDRVIRPDAGEVAHPQP